MCQRSAVKNSQIKENALKFRTNFGNLTRLQNSAYHRRISTRPPWQWLRSAKNIILQGKLSVRRSTEAIMDSRLSLAFILISSVGFSSGFFLGGSENDGTVRFHKGSQFGFEKNPSVYAHLVIPPWNRAFKPGYCASWEWHTDKKYRDKRVAICKQFTEGTFAS